MSQRNPGELELRHLRTFLVVAETQNFTRAGERLGLSQPSVSQQVKELEQALSAELFVRLGPKVRLTPAGRAFQGRAEAVLAKLKQACRAVGQVEGLDVGHLEVGVIPPLNLPWMPSALTEFAQRHPGVSVSVREKSSPEVETDVESGHCELGVNILSRSSPNLSYELLRRDELVFIDAGAGHAGGPVDRASLLAARLVLLPEGFFIRQLVEEALRRARVQVRVALEVSSIAGVLQCAAQSSLATILPAVVLEGAGHRGLRKRPLEGWKTAIDFGLVWPGSAEPSPAARALADILRANARANGGEPKGGPSPPGRRGKRAAAE